MSEIAEKMPVSEKLINHDYKLSIDGNLEKSEAVFDVLNPANNEVIARAPDADAEQMEKAISAAKRAFESWSKLEWEARSDYIQKFADALDQKKEELATLLTLEQGKPLNSQATVEVEMAIYWMREVAKRRLEVEEIENTNEHIVEVHHTPLGVVGAITPWNFPVLLSLWKLAPCLVTGNTMVLKPSPYTPLTSLYFGEIASRIFPRGVFNVVSGGDQLGQQMSEHGDIAKIGFTGSIATGKKVMASSSSNLKRITLELGGNDPAIVLADSEWREIIPSLFWAAFGNSGQWCIAIKRLYVQSSIFDDFVNEFVKYAKNMKVGDGLDKDTDLGPIQNRMQYNKLLSLFADTRDKGYDIALGGEIDENVAGNFVPITVVKNPPEDSRVVKEEPFGPLLPIISFDSIEDVVGRANDTEFGLAASVWGNNPEQVNKIANELEAGTVWTNEIHIHGIDIPFGGHKLSGMGVENGYEGMREFTNTKTYMFKK